jgi:hypothetical protein
VPRSLQHFISLNVAGNFSWLTAQRYAQMVSSPLRTAGAQRSCSCITLEACLPSCPPCRRARLPPICKAAAGNVASVPHFARWHGGCSLARGSCELRGDFTDGRGVLVILRNGRHARCLLGSSTISMSNPGVTIFRMNLDGRYCVRRTCVYAARRMAWRRLYPADAFGSGQDLVTLCWLRQSSLSAVQTMLKVGVRCASVHDVQAGRFCWGG